MAATDTPNADLFVAKGRSKPIEMGHPWVFADAVVKTDGVPAAGDVVRVRDHRGKFIAQGCFNPTSRIAVKLLSWDENERIDRAFWTGRIGAAVALRNDFPGLSDPVGAFRLVNAEGDGLPGLIVDRYADFLVVQFLTPGTASRAEVLVDLLHELTGPAGIVERVDAEVARHEGLARKASTLWGETPPETVEIVEGPARFLVDVLGGHKTGWYLDQRDNRLRVAELARGRRVLDAFCYTGGFAVQAALGGATSVTGVDSSASTLELARRNAEHNGVTVEFHRGSAFERLRMLKLEGAEFDMVVLDPPKLARGRSGVPKALRAYKDADLSALKLLTPGGFLVTCCCSGVVTDGDFLRALGDAAADAGRDLRVVEMRGAAADHPFTPACPETDYLRCLVARVVN